MYTKAECYGDLQYIIRYPNGYEDGKRYPILLYLHGAGSRYFTPERTLGTAFFTETDKYTDLPFITIVPICAADTWFDVFPSLRGLLKLLSAADYADPDRIYLMGTSMGGYAAWQLAMSLPELLAAMVPICGGGMYWNAARLKNLPIWAHHGSVDTVVFPEESRKMVDAVNAAGGNAKLTIYEGVAHPAWIPVFRNPEIFDWLLSHRRASGESSTEGNEYNSAEKFG